MRIVSVGEVLWDVFSDREFLGGAPLNFSAAGERLGDRVALLTGVGEDARGERALTSMRALGLTTDFVFVRSEWPTGTAIVTVDEAGSASYLIPRPAAFDALPLGDKLLAELGSTKPDWVYFGTLAQTGDGNEENLGKVLAAAPGARRLYDLNLRTGLWKLALVERLSALATVIKMNDDEAETLSGLTLGGEFRLEKFCRYWSERFGVETLCVTMGSQGCAVFVGDRLETYPGYKVKVVDTVGAGDAFTAAFLHGLHSGWPMEEIAPFANSVGAVVASRAGATPHWTEQECRELMATQAG